MKRAGLDIGSTTVKAAVIGENDELLYSQYRRHFSDIRKTVFDIISELGEHFKGERMMIAVTGSGGISVSKWLGIPFVQEVAAGTNAIKKLIPRTDVAIELGGEDAKITYLTGGLEQRMNGSCAGGTGAFIDQMAALLNTDIGGLNELAKGTHDHIPDSLPLRRFREERHSAAAQRRRKALRRRCFGIPVGGKPDNKRTCLR